MKRLFNIMMFVAVAAMGITACQNEPTEINVSAKKVTIEVIGELDATRSSFGDFVENGDADYYPSKWDGGEQVVFSLNEAALVTAENTGTGSNATFSVGLTDDETTEGTIYAFSPKGNYSTGKGGFTNINASYQDMYVVVPTEQNPSTTSVDPEAHLLAGKATYDNGLPSSIKMTFNHVAAYGRMEITNFAEEITKVKITASAPLAGTSCFYYYAGEKMGQLTNADQTTITINNPAADNKVFWFGCAPADLSEGTLEVKVYTADASYTRSIDLTGKTLSFVQGQVANFRVNMSGIAKDVVDETSYALVTSLADIEDGLYIIAGYDSANDKYYALPNAAKTTAGRIAGTQVTVTDNLVSGVGAEDYMWTFTKSGEKFTITNGEYYFDQSGSSNTSLKVTTNEATWSISTSSIAGCFKLVPDAAVTRMLLFRAVEDDYGNNLEFGAYAFSNETNSDYSGIFLFKYGGTYKAALAAPVVTATADGNSITVSWGAVEGAANYTVSCDGFDDKTVTGTSVTYTELEYSTMYNFSVVANPTDTENNTASNPGTASATTEADPNAEAPTSGYKLITSMAELTTGEYVIVGTNGTSNYAMPNQSTSGKPTATLVTIVDDVISTANASGFVWTITVTGTNCTIYNGSSYLGYSSSTNFATSNSAYNWAVSVVDNLFKIVPNSGTTRAILYRTTGVFAPYAFSNVGNEYKYVSLYKKIENAGGGDEPDTPVQLAAPTNLSATSTTNTATVTWTAVDNASSYDVTVGTTTKNVTTTTATFDGLTPDITYNVSVVAVGDGTNYTNSTEATTTVKTLAESGGGDTTTEELAFDTFYSSTATQTAVTTASGDTFNVTFTQGDASTKPQWYTSDSGSVRIYAKSTFTIASTNGKNIKSIVINAKLSSTANKLTANSGTYTSSHNTSSYLDSTWTGDAQSVTFTVGGTSGHIRLDSITVTY
ncbi:MAG: fibronectin type III domain-containing protein [Alistipes sp.]|nr:fibronectin type III domain-containing protein [Alistipes sp.]